MRVGVEVGGTFTDLVWESNGEIGVVKVPSTPAHPDIGALSALDRLNGQLTELTDLVHGSTVATNAILERKGATLGLLVTKGTRDLLALQRHNRRQIYDLRYEKPEAVVERRHVLEVDERVDADGSIVRPLDLAKLKPELVGWLSENHFDAIAVCLLNSYSAPAHERQLKTLLREIDVELAISCSSEVAREFREYERCTTTTLSAFVQPVMSRYLERFASALAQRGYDGPFSVMQSNGGRLPAKGMASSAIRALFSGPAAGVVGAIAAAERSGHRDLISLDMGGTSTDVCLIENARPTLTGMVEIDGLPIKTPVIDMVTVGAGGGSIIWIDDGDMLRVGPQSAGAEPGPACYGRGGILPTITDAHVVRGTLQVDALLGGEMQADLDAAKESMRPVADALDLDLAAAADSAIRVAEANIVRAIQRVSTERGRDPRGYSLVPFGGAGPMLAARLAEDLGIETVVVPPHAGVLSAFGLLAADYVHFETQTRRVAVSEKGLPAIKQTISELTQAVRDRLAELGLTGEPVINVVLEMRYVGQAFEIPVLLGGPAEALDLSALRHAFNDAHRRVFEFDKGGHGECEVVSFRVSGAITPGNVPAMRIETIESVSQQVEIVEYERRKLCDRMQRAALTSAVEGPALIEDKTSTLYLPDGWTACHDRHANLMLCRSDHASTNLGGEDQ